MKNMKKLVSLLTALLMVIAMCVPAMAADTTTTSYTITINSTDTNHTYEAYQVFTGDLSEGVLSNIEWGSGVNSENLLTALTGVTSGALYKNGASVFSGVTTAAGVAEVLGKYSNDSDEAKAFADIVATKLASLATATFSLNTEKTAYTATVNKAGYYFVKDQDNSLDNKTDEAYTRYILKVVKDTSVNPKSDVPTVEKKVDDKNDSDTSEDEIKWQDSADYDIGDSIPYQLTGTLPSNYADYSTYSYTFTDTLSAGLTYNNDAKVYVVDGTTETEITAGYTAGCTGDSSLPWRRHIRQTLRIRSLRIWL